MKDELIRRADIMAGLTSAEMQRAVKNGSGQEVYNRLLEIINFCPATEAIALSQNAVDIIDELLSQEMRICSNKILSAIARRAKRDITECMERYQNIHDAFVDFGTLIHFLRARTVDEGSGKQ